VDGWTLLLAGDSAIERTLEAHGMGKDLPVEMWIAEVNIHS
jgi:hypothetical protein